VLVRWVTGELPDGLVVDVQRRRPGATVFSAWRTGVTEATATWWPPLRGTWTMRARVRDPEGGGASAWSPQRRLVVA
jgi:hypothetical protein